MAGQGVEKRIVDPRNFQVRNMKGDVPKDISLMDIYRTNEMDLLVHLDLEAVKGRVSMMALDELGSVARVLGWLGTERNLDEVEFTAPGDAENLFARANNMTHPRKSTLSQVYGAVQSELERKTAVGGR